MRRSAWTIGAALIAALSIGVAACGGDDSGDDASNAPKTGSANPSEASRAAS